MNLVLIVSFHKFKKLMDSSNGELRWSKNFINALVASLSFRNRPIGNSCLQDLSEFLEHSASTVISLGG